jgi:hypothetical protein
MQRRSKRKGTSTEDTTTSDEEEELPLTIGPQIGGKKGRVGAQTEGNKARVGVETEIKTVEVGPQTSQIAVNKGKVGAKTEVLPSTHDPSDPTRKGTIKYESATLPLSTPVRMNSTSVSYSTIKRSVKRKSASFGPPPGCSWHWFLVAHMKYETQPTGTTTGKEVKISFQDHKFQLAMQKQMPSLEISAARKIEFLNICLQVYASL